jgi:hypothetical protein
MLEARWAAWFALVGVPAQYEPEAWLGYIPDFIVKPSHYTHRVVVEVKGALEAFDLRKIRAAGWGIDSEQEDVRYGNVLLLTSDGPQNALHYYVSGSLARHSERMCLESVRVVNAGAFLRETDAAAHIAAMNEAWNEAGNTVQWRGAR